MNGRIVCVLGLLLCISSETASAQDKGDTGLAISIPTVGVIWHPSNQGWLSTVDFSFGLTESDGEGSIPRHQLGGFTFGIGALLYTHRWDELPDLRQSPSLLTRIRCLTSTTRWTAPIRRCLRGAYPDPLGAYSLGERFSVFAEVGLLYSSQRIGVVIIRGRDRSHDLDIRPRTTAGEFSTS